MYMYQVGDRVRVRCDLNQRQTYYTANKEDYNSATNDMVLFAGKVVTISDQIYGQYRVKECAFYWTDEMFEGLEDKDTTVFEFNPEDLF